jgi:hypothetical protein
MQILEESSLPESLNFITLYKSQFWRNGPRQAEECVLVVAVVPYRAHEMWQRNNYKLPHMSKEKLARHGLLPDNIACSLALYNNACKRMNTA